jgi:glycerol kinase
MQVDSSARIVDLRVDGGAAVMDFLCQFQADLLGIPVRRPRHTETTALGAAYLAGLGAGIWSDADVAGLWKLDREFTPIMSRDEADTLQDGWRRAVERSRGWATPDNQ